MDVFLGEWLNLLLRWAHMIVGIGWIGTSFYFMALDYGLDTRERKSAGVYGTACRLADHGRRGSELAPHGVLHPPKLDLRVNICSFRGASRGSPTVRPIS